MNHLFQLRWDLPVYLFAVCTPQIQAGNTRMPMRNAQSRLLVQRRQRGGISKLGRGRGKKAKSSKVNEPAFCNSCNFSVRYEDSSAVQITNGQIVSSDQIIGVVDEIAICDNCKCQSTNVDSVIMDVEGECDVFFGIDVLEFTVTATTTSGEVNIVCPDVSYFASAAC